MKYVVLCTRREKFPDGVVFGCWMEIYEYAVLSFRIIQNFSRFGFLIILAKVYGEAEQFLLLMGL